MHELQWHKIFTLPDIADKTRRPTSLPLLIADRRHAIFGHNPSSSRQYSGARRSEPHYQCPQRGSARSRSEASSMGRPWKTRLQQVEADQRVDTNVDTM